MTSREIAELTGKELGNVHRDIRAMLISLYGDEHVTKLVPEQYRNRHSEYIRENAEAIFKAVLGDDSDWNHQPPRGFSWTRDNRGYVTSFSLDHSHTMTLVAGYNVKLRKAIIDRWRELEAAQGQQVPQTYAQALLEAGRLALQVEQQQEQLALAAPKVQFVDRYVSANGLKGFREVCKLLKANEARFRDFLIERQIMYRLAGVLTAYQNHIDAGRFEVRTGLSDSDHAYTSTKFTAKGIDWIAGEWAKHQLHAEVVA